MRSIGLFNCINANHATLSVALWPIWGPRFKDLEIRRAFTVFQLMTILEETRNFLIVIEHDPLLYENAQGIVEYVSQGLHDAAKEAAVLLCSPGTDTFMEDMTRNADKVFYFDEGPRAATKLISKAYPEAEKSQITLEAWTCSNYRGNERLDHLSPNRCRPKAHGADGQEDLANRYTRW